MALSSKYQIAFVGGCSRRAEIEACLFSRIKELGVLSSQIKVLEEADVNKADPRSPVVAVLFGRDDVRDADHPCLIKLLRDSVTIIACVGDITKATSQLPPSLQHINAFPLLRGEASVARLVGLILENLKLLRTERRLFISYRRAESQSVAIQLYERLEAAGFDVFLDTRGVPYGVDFQAILWHRMADSDVVVLLDTPNFRASRWTREELTRANATNVQILHLLWPGVPADASSAFSEFLPLERSDFRNRNMLKEHARLTSVAIRKVAIRAESLRARALSARHRSLVDSFCDKAREEGATAVAVQPERYISVKFATGRHVAVVPTIGVPRADRCHDIEKAIAGAGTIPDHVWLLYDDRGILQAWIEHLEWLNKHLPVHAVQITKCALRLRGGGA